MEIGVLPEVLKLGSFADVKLRMPPSMDGPDACGLLDSRSRGYAALNWGMSGKEGHQGAAVRLLDSRRLGRVNRIE